MRRELADFLDYCRIERRLAPLTCSAYERDVAACLSFLEREGVVTVAEVRPAHLRRFLAAGDAAPRAVEPGSHRRRAEGTWPKANAAWWRQKIEANKRRDRDTDAQLAKAGWTVIRVWEHEDPMDAAGRIVEVVRAATR